MTLTDVIGKRVTVIIDRPLGSYHPEYPDMYYPVNYGYVANVMAQDGEPQDVYVLGVDVPVEVFEGVIIAVVHRDDDVEEKWVAAPEGISFTADEIMEQISFTEKYYRSSVIMDNKVTKIVDNMISWAKSRLGDTNYCGMCLAFIEDALEQSNNIEIFGGDCARESYEIYSDALQTGLPEKGAFVFYDCLCIDEGKPVNWGHCGICLGEGRIIHCWDKVRIDDYLAVENLRAPSGDHPRYLGWVPVERVLRTVKEDNK